MNAQPRAPSVVDDAPPGERAVQAEETQPQQLILRDPGVRALVASRFATAAGLATLSYGVMLYVATTGASQVTVSLIDATRYVAALLFGIGGGAVADAMSKRSALAAAYALQATACFVVPTLLGTSIGSFVLLMFLVAALGQIVTPAVKAATALVTTTAQVAVVAAIISVAGGIGEAIGSGFLAPVLIKVSTMTTVVYAAGVILAVGAVRTLAMPAGAGATSLRRTVRGMDWQASVPTLRRTAEWLLANRALAGMVLIGSIVIALFNGMNTLMPVYVRDVLGADPTNAVYILAPGGIGFLAGSVFGPKLMDRHGERTLALTALGVLNLGFMFFGLIDLVAPLLAPISPLRLLALIGVSLPPPIQAAGLISILTAFGSTAAGAAVQTYINRYVRQARQASTFGMESVLDNALTLVAVVGLGLLATLLGSRLVFIVATPLVVAIVLWLIWASFRITKTDPPDARDVLRDLRDAAPPDAAELSDSAPATDGTASEA